MRDRLELPSDSSDLPDVPKLPAAASEAESIPSEQIEIAVFGADEQVGATVAVEIARTR